MQELKMLQKALKVTEDDEEQRALEEDIAGRV